MEQFVGYSSQDLKGVDEDGFDVKSDTEIHFTAKTTLDSGLEVGAHVQLEGNTSSDQIDESYLTLGGSFGRITLGSENSAMYLGHVAPRHFGIGINSGDAPEWYSYDGVGGRGGVFRGPFGSTRVEPNRVNDANRLTYFSPRFSGFRLGASYVPDSVEDSNDAIDRDASLHDGATVSADYSGSFGDMGVRFSAGYGQMSLGNDRSGDDPTAMNFGAKISFKDVALAVSYAQSNDDTSLGNMHGTHIALNYEPGPWMVTLQGFFSERDGSATANAGGSGSRAAELSTIHLEAAYDLGGGVSIVGALGAVDLQDESGFGQDNEAVYAVTDFRVRF